MSKGPQTRKAYLVSPAPSPLPFLISQQQYHPPAPAVPEAVSPPLAASVAWCLHEELLARLVSHQPPPLQEGRRPDVSASPTCQLRAILSAPLPPASPCSHSSTSMLGGMLRARLAMCFRSVVLPLLENKNHENPATQGNPGLPLGPIFSPVGSHQPVAAAGHNVQVSIDEQLLAVGRDAELFQLQPTEWMSAGQTHT